MSQKRFKRKKVSKGKNKFCERPWGSENLLRSVSKRGKTLYI